MASNPSPEIRNAARLEALRQSGLLDTPPEQAFERFTELAQLVVGAPVVLISLVDKDRQFFKSQIGLPEPWASARETPLSHSFCQHVVESRQPLVLSDAREDERLKDNLAITDIGIIAYAGVPLQTQDGQVLGSFCAIDNQPRQWSESELQILRTLAEMVIREVELRRLAQYLQEKFENLQQAEGRRDDLVQMIVHDLRTPLASLSGGLQALEAISDGADNSQRQMLSVALRSTRSLTQMVNTILDVSRSDAGKLDLQRRFVSPLTVITSAIDQVEQLSQRKDQSLSFDIAGGLPQLWADESQLVRVLVNLLGNAIQHTPASGRIRVSVERAIEDGQSHLWCVADNGAGIAPEDLESIFEKFGQAETRNRALASSGLGLTFCKLVIEAHGGRIWVESQPGKGSTFCFTLPPESSAN